MKTQHKLILVTGGARSGKSIYAEKLAKELSEKVVYLATAVAVDLETVERIKDHQAARPD
ncbi:MAG: bifunctional adenosylcobinamide kinase/adenosylcobinamide-phosphate guanylyltransferase, partial [Candidatus Contubernalis sp.]|nr:bifunctional adenosylcobinamide kinase/adenosylcobinamide-phosphate guanylyltransferase [Candidatus Contubernalis sp.]